MVQSPKLFSVILNSKTCKIGRLIRNTRNLNLQQLIQKWTSIKFILIRNFLLQEKLIKNPFRKRKNLSKQKLEIEIALHNLWKLIYSNLKGRMKRQFLVKFEIIRNHASMNQYQKNKISINLILAWTQPSKTTVMQLKTWKCSKTQFIRKQNSRELKSNLKSLVTTKHSLLK